MIFLMLGLLAKLDDPAENLYQKGLMEEVGRGNLRAAVEIYEEVVRTYPERRDVAARAQLHIGICYEKMGDAPKAMAAYRRVLDIFFDKKDLNELARRGIERLKGKKIRPGGWWHVGFDLRRTLYNPSGSKRRVQRVPFREAWRRPVPDTPPHNLLAGDVDGMGDLEVLVLSNPYLYAFKNDGSGWQANVAAEAGVEDLELQSMDLGDLDGDGVPEILVSGCCRTPPYRRRPCFLLVYGGDGRLVRKFRGPDAEVCIVSWVGGGDLALWVNTGYPKTPRGLFLYDYATGKEKWEYLIGPQPAFPGAVADIDGDGRVEFCGGGYAPNNGMEANGMDDGHSWIWTVREDGSGMWRRKVRGPATGTSLADMDGDGRMEVIAWASGHDSGTLLILDGSTGKVLRKVDSGFVESLAVADLDGDGNKEIATSSSEGTVRVYGTDLDISAERSFGCKMFVGGVNDIDGDGTSELVVWSPMGKVVVMDRSLRTLWEEDVGGPVWSLVICDFLDDGTNEIVLTSGMELVVFKAPSRTSICFTDVARSVGVASLRDGRGIAWVDMDGDGDLDLYVANASEGNELYVNMGNGAFLEVSGEAGVSYVGHSVAPAWGDYDGDEDLDLYIANYGQANVLYRNEGNGTFVEVTREAKVGISNEGVAASWIDYDLDGDLDLFTARNPCVLFRNDGRRFTDVTKEVGLDISGVIEGTAWGDYDGDGDMDLFVAGERVGKLFRNDGGRFTEVTEEAEVVNSSAGRGPVWVDYDDDGDLDLFVANVSETSKLFRNRGDGTFEDVTAFSGLAGVPGQSGAWGDYDNDGDLDLYIVRLGANVLFRNEGDGTFKDVTEEVGVGDLGNGKSASWADYDRDGDLDLYVCNQLSSNVLYRNEGSKGHFLAVRLKGNPPNTCAFGAKVRLVAGGRFQFREVTSGCGYATQGPLELHFGLGKSTVADSLIVRWPDGKVQVWTQVEGDRWLTIEEGKGKISEEARR